MYKNINIYYILIVSCIVFIVVENSVHAHLKYVIQKSLNTIFIRLSSLVSSVIEVYFKTQVQTYDSRMINEFCIVKVLHNEVLFA